MDWIQFHDGYDAWPPLQARLRIVREHLSRALSVCPPGPIRILSLCAGDGRDLIGLLPEHPRRDDVNAYLIENNPELVQRGEAAVTHFDLASYVRFLCADATVANTYLSLVPADVVLVAGVFGNMYDEGGIRLIQSLRCLCRPSGTVIWTRRLVKPQTEQSIMVIREGFQRAGFLELAMNETGEDGFVIATVAYHGVLVPLVPDTSLFEFIGYDQMKRV